MSVINATGFSVDISVLFAVAVRNAFGRQVGLSFKSGSKPRLYDQGKSPDGESHTVASLKSRCVRRREMIPGLEPIASITRKRMEGSTTT